jgi:hypothetical protein
MAPGGILTVDESSSGIAKVALDPNIKNGEFYQVFPRRYSVNV